MWEDKKVAFREDLEEARWRTIVFVCRSISLRDAFKLDVITDVTVLRL